MSYHNVLAELPFAKAAPSVKIYERDTTRPTLWPFPAFRLLRPFLPSLGDLFRSS